MIIVIGLTVGEKATMGVPDIIAHMLSHVFYALGSILFGIATLIKGWNNAERGGDPDGHRPGVALRDVRDGLKSVLPALAAARHRHGARLDVVGIRAPLREEA